MCSMVGFVGIVYVVLGVVLGVFVIIDVLDFSKTGGLLFKVFW